MRGDFFFQLLRSTLGILQFRYKFACRKSCVEQLTTAIHKPDTGGWHRLAHLKKIVYVTA